MPIPEPQELESDAAFMNRCMADVVMVAEFPNQMQRLAVCAAQLEDRDDETD